MAGHRFRFATQTQIHRELNGGNFDDGHGFVHRLVGKIGRRGYKRYGLAMSGLSPRMRVVHIMPSTFLSTRTLNEI